MQRSAGIDRKALGSAIAKPSIPAYIDYMGSNETPAEMAVRHVLEGEKHIADQTALIERLRLMDLGSVVEAWGAELKVPQTVFTPLTVK
ncbi:hypothetical protein ATY76_19785 [Rhizobium sp. R339]|uniref:hypothetical protein n=1 Tax=Rhizobium sp. R339 TaxID=1764273 RepID=UPI000B53808A|nr:hypothetical protein [Rhizobium sp. R339]OWV65475.1 hypothetical protein ATY76_19785 [Rhizobium sp. R339]